MASETVSDSIDLGISLISLTALPGSMAQKKILYIQYSNPAAYPPLERSSRMLADAGWQVVFLSAGTMGDADGLRFSPHPGVTVRQLPFCWRGWRSRPGWQQKVHYISYAAWVLAWGLFWRPDWVYASDLLACPVALPYSLLSRRRVLYHEHDFPGDATGGLLGRIYYSARRRLARRANVCVLPNLERARRFTQETGGDRNAFCVWNCPGMDEVGPERATTPPARLRLIYLGSIVPDRLPMDILHALAQLPAAVTLTVAGYETVGYPEYMMRFLEAADELGVAARVEYVGALPHRQGLDLCSECDVGLSLMPLHSHDLNMAAMVGASNKPFEYLACGLALLVTDLPDWRALYVDAGCGLSCDPSDASSIAAVLRWFLDHPGETRLMGETGRARILQDWNYERQFTPVLTALESTAGTRRERGCQC